MTLTNIVLVICTCVIALLLFTIFRTRIRIRKSNSLNQSQKTDEPSRQEQNTDGSQMLYEIIKNFPRVKALAEEAKQNGATHFEGVGPAICFYRSRNGKVERCFAEYLPATRRHEWVWPPSEWHADRKIIPQNAKSIPEDI